MWSLWESSHGGKKDSWITNKPTSQIKYFWERERESLFVRSNTVFHSLCSLSGEAHPLYAPSSEVLTTHILLPSNNKTVQIIRKAGTIRQDYNDFLQIFLPPTFWNTHWRHQFANYKFCTRNVLMLLTVRSVAQHGSQSTFRKPHAVQMVSSSLTRSVVYTTRMCD